MGYMTLSARRRCLRHLITEEAITPTANIYLGLSTSSPGAGATGASANEVANSGGYARTAITFGAASARRVTQNADVEFPLATANWASGNPITHWFIVDNQTYGSGNVLAYGAFASSFVVLSGHQRTVPSGEVYIDATASGAGGGLTNAAVHGLLDRLFRNQAFTVSANFLALFTTAPTDSTGGTEVTSSNNYSRTEIHEPGGSNPSWEAEDAAAVENEEAANFGAPSGSWGNIKAAGILTASSSGTLLWWLDIPDQDVGAETTQIGFPIGALDLAITGS